MAKEVKNDRKENGYSENVNVRVVYKEFSVLMFMTAGALFQSGPEASDH
jgi:hypothetical protein